MIRSKKLIKYKNLKHGFFNKIGGVSKGIYRSLNCGIGSLDNKKNVLKNLNIVSKKIGCKNKNLIILKQKHSDKFYIARKINKKRISADGVITRSKNLALCILTADCAPLLIYDPKKKIIAAAHLGWKGAYKKIAIKIFNKLLKLGSKKEDLIVAIGPCISNKNYEVQKDFKRKFYNQSKENSAFFKLKKNKIYFSLNEYIFNQISNYGIKNIDIIRKDTFNKKNKFFSARRSLKLKENDYGRNISIIMIK